MGTLFFRELICRFRNFTKKIELSVFEIYGVRLRSHGTRRVSVKRGARVWVRVSVNPKQKKPAFFAKKKKNNKIDPEPGPDPNPKPAFY